MYQVGAIIEDLPKNSHFQFDMLLPMLDQKDSYDADWGSTNYHTYFLLKDGVAVNDLSAKMNQVFVEKFTLEVSDTSTCPGTNLLSRAICARTTLPGAENTFIQPFRRRIYASRKYCAGICI